MRTRELDAPDADHVLGHLAARLDGCEMSRFAANRRRGENSLVQAGKHLVALSSSRVVSEYCQVSQR